jgi:hypothetical protein
MQSRLNHIAALVPSVQFAAEALATYGFPIGPCEEWDGEGTREIYVGAPGVTGRLLLMEPIREGAYTRALEKRGPGIHHIAIDVLDIESYVENLAGSGWLLHPKSLGTLRQSQTAYLARPSIPTLIEVQQREALTPTTDRVSDFVSQLRLPLPEPGAAMMKAIGLETYVQSAPGEILLRIQDAEIDFKNLLP